MPTYRQYYIGILPILYYPLQIITLVSLLKIHTHTRTTIKKLKPMQNFLENLKKYLEETPYEEISRAWEKSAEMDKIGITVEDFLANSDANYSVTSHTPASSSFPPLNDLSSEFSSGFFYATTPN